MGKIAKLLTVLISLVLIVGAIGVAMLAFPIFGNQALIVRSGSMEPAIGVGSVVIVRQAPSNYYKVGDVISFNYNKNTIITHRITEVINEPAGILYKTKGDANEEEDNWTVAKKDILGKNYFTIPEFGKLLAFARTKYGFPTLIIFPAALVIIIEFINIIREVKKTKRRKIELIHPLSFDEPFVNYKTAFTKRNFGLVKLLLPFMIFSVFIQSTSAFFSDTETSKGNFFQAAASFGTPTPTPTVTPTPTPTSGNCNNIINITGGGFGSSVEAYIKCITRKTVIQNNNTNVNTNVNQSSTTGGNSSNNNTGGGNTNSGNASNSAEVVVGGSQNNN